MKNRFTRGGALLAVSSLALLSLAGTASANPADDTVASHTAATTTAEAQRVEKFWTRDRMRDAVPVEELIDVDSKVTRPGTVSAGSPVTIPPTTAPTTKGDVGTQAFPHPGGEWTGGGAITKTAGRVFFSYQGRTASCSGNAVNSQNKSTVITAGHCVKLEGAWHTNWMFVPGYSNGSEPHGRWTAAKTMATPQWGASEDINYDVGAAVVNPLGGQSLTDVVGGQGIAFNQARGQDMYSFGWPAADPYDGTKMIYCSGTVIDDFLLTQGIGMNCDMTGGSSGGPWFLSFSESSGTGIQNSVNSFKYNFLPNYMFGPYFGSDAQNLYNQAQAA
ncbi:MAG: trypsin-like serine peptidase [Micromonosporaceae bacterium]